MSNSYPSRRDLRLQREREERSKLRDEEAQRWAEEVEQREQRAAEAEREATETVAKVTPVPASRVTGTTSDTTPVDETSSVPEEMGTQDDAELANAQGRRAAASPVDAPADVDEPSADVPAPRRRRADSQVTSTGMLPIITKRSEEENESKPLSRREAREQAARADAERRAEIAALEQQQANLEESAEPKVVRRATSPQAPPPPIPAVTETPVGSEEDDIVVSTSEQYGASAVEITDMSGLDTIEIRREALRAETEELTQEIVRLGQENPNVIDPLLLRRQKELAEKSQELQELETAAVSVVESSDDEPELDDAPRDAVADADVTQGVPEHSDVSDDESDDPDEDTATHDATDSELLRRAKRAGSRPMITGPFEVAEEDEAVETVFEPESKPDFSTHFEPATETDNLPTTGPDQPLDASSAHGLDTLDPKESEAPERRILTISAIVFAIGIIALIVAIILFTR
ncbi:MAG: hypothetical protein HLX51_12345 [Micrococcaceae bacterium]|nr:hypothetical protein [Micrococcaceae bacterium]